MATPNTPISAMDPAEDPSVWALKPGDEVERKELQQRYGGRTQGGIGPSRARGTSSSFPIPSLVSPTDTSTAGERTGASTTPAKDNAATNK